MNSRFLHVHIPSILVALMAGVGLVALAWGVTRGLRYLLAAYFNVALPDIVGFALLGTGYVIAAGTAMSIYKKRARSAGKPVWSMRDNTNSNHPQS